jgi:integrase
VRGNITRRGDHAWRIRIYLGRDPDTGAKRWLSRTVHGTRATADTACARLLTEVAAGYHADSSRTVGEVVNRWMAGHDLSPSTRRDYRYVIDRHIVPTWGDQPLAKLTPDALERWYRLVDCGPQRTRKIHNVLSGAMDAAVRWRWLAVNPCDAARPPKITERPIQPPTAAQVRRLIDAADPDLACFVHLAAHTGARRGELVALRWSDVDLERAVITISRSMAVTQGGTQVKTTKTDRTRVVAIDEPTVAVLRAHRTRQREIALAVGSTADGPVFASDDAARGPWYPDSVSRRFRKLCAATYLSGIRLHDLRHFTATQMIAAGYPIRTVAGRLGHRNVSTLLDRYAHFEPESDRKAAEGLGRLMAGD